MKLGRRKFVKTSIAAGALASLNMKIPSIGELRQNVSELDHIARQPVFKKEFFNENVIIESLELTEYKGNYILKVTSKDGATGLSVSNNRHMAYLYPLLQQIVIPFFIGKDARNLDELVDGIYLHKSTYKLQGLALWISVATVEFAILDMMGRIANKPIPELIGDFNNKEISVYRANNYRGKSAEESLERIKKNVEETGAKALKFKIGGRMSNNADYPPGRTEKLIPMVREAFGYDMTIYADSNGSYTVDKAIEIGKLLEEYKYDFYEEPVPFDWLEETRDVANALSIPIAGGEQETSMRRFKWLIANNALQIVQPDLFYFGGMIRSMRVARMAESKGIPCIPHISNSGLGYIYMFHFVAALSNAGPYHEFKGINKKIPMVCDTSSLKSENGKVAVPSGPGLGITIDQGYLKKHSPVS